MKTNRLSYFAALTALLAGAALTSCGEDHQLTLDGEEAHLMEGITLEVSETLMMGVGQDSTLVYSVTPADLEDRTVVFSSSDTSVATVGSDGTIHAVAVGEAVIQATSSLGFQVYDAQASVVVNVIPEIIKATEINITDVTDRPDGESNIFVTDEIQLAAEILPADHTYDRITWGTSDPAKATVDEKGLVTCTGAGHVTIYAAANDHSGVRGAYDLDIKEYVEATAVSIARLDAPVCITRGEFSLDVTYTPANATVGSVTWTSDDASVATVHRGRVTPTGFGTANLTATCSNGTQATVQVTVEPGWYIWDAQNAWGKWSTNKDASADIRGDKVWHIGFKPAAAGAKWRQDFSYTCSKDAPLDLYLMSYPVMAVRMTKINGGNSTLDAVEIGTGLNAGNPNPKNGIDLGDGTQLLIYNLGTRPNFANLDLAQFRVFQVKLADIPNENITAGVNDFYEIHWIRTFKSEDEAKAFAQDEVSQGK